MWGYDLEYAGSTGTENKILVVKRPNIPAPLRDYKEVDIPGRDGMLYIDEGTNQDIEITVEFNFMGEPQEWFSLFRKAKRWLLQGGEHDLVLYDDRDFFFRVKKVEIDTAERVCYEIGRFSAVFFCSGYHYAKSGLAESDEFTDGLLLDESGELLVTEEGEEIVIEITSTVLFNDFDKSMPIYKIYGEGVCVLTVNGKSMSANVGQNLVIDTERKVAYRLDGTAKNTDVSGWYEDLWLVPGDNVLTVSPGFKCIIIPNWRCR